MNTAKIIIGANFGDEGKGLMTDYFANQAKELNKSCLVVCHNGGSQRGHTVVSPTGVRHVFHHFGSGCFAGADTYLSSDFILNPIIFNKELSELNRKGLVTECYVNKNCLVTTPFDMMINQIVEEYRGDSKHGSCGLGIFETIVRSNRAGKYTTILELAGLSVDELIGTLSDDAINYLPNRLKELGVEDIPLDWVKILNNYNPIIPNFIVDLHDMLENITFVDDSIIDDYDYVIFEGAQGLLLDQNNLAYMPHLTPSNTGIKNPMRIIGDRKCDIEVCYVSRTYMTRHGAGRFDSECEKSEINEKMIDLTNVPNPYQDSLRYGILNLYELRERIRCDFGAFDIKPTVVFTHWNEHELDGAYLRRVFKYFNSIYISDGMTRNDVNYYN